MESNNRISYIDTAKAIAIILMVAAHSTPPPVLIRFIAIFHMPLFFFFSGYFLKMPKTRKDFWTLVRKRMKGLYLPYIKWSLLFLVLHNVFYRFHLYHSDYVYYGVYEYPYSLKDFLVHAVLILFTMDYHEQLLGGFWFLKTLLLGSIFSTCFLYLFQRLWKKDPIKSKWLLVILSWGATIFLRWQNISLPILGSMYIITYGAIYYLLGSIYKHYEMRLSCLNKRKIVISMLICLCVVAVWYHGMAMTSVPFYDIFYSPVLALMGIMVVTYFSKQIELNHWSRAFHYIGQNTMTILALHLVSFKLVSLVKVWYFNMTIDHLAEFPVIKADNDILWILYTVIGIVIPLSIKECWSKTIIFFLWKK